MQGNWLKSKALRAYKGAAGNHVGSLSLWGAPSDHTVVYTEDTKYIS